MTMHHEMAVHQQMSDGAGKLFRSLSRKGSTATGEAVKKLSCFAFDPLTLRQIELEMAPAVRKKWMVFSVKIIKVVLSTDQYSLYLMEKPTGWVSGSRPTRRKTTGTSSSITSPQKTNSSGAQNPNVAICSTLKSEVYGCTTLTASAADWLANNELTEDDLPSKVKAVKRKAEEQRNEVNVSIAATDEVQYYADSTSSRTSSTAGLPHQPTHTRPSSNSRRQLVGMHTQTTDDLGSAIATQIRRSLSRTSNGEADEGAQSDEPPCNLSIDRERAETPAALKSSLKQLERGLIKRPFLPWVDDPPEFPRMAESSGFKRVFNTSDTSEVKKQAQSAPA